MNKQTIADSTAISSSAEPWLSANERTVQALMAFADEYASERAAEGADGSGNGAGERATLESAIRESLARLKPIEPVDPASRESDLDALRSEGWTVAVHNDYRQNGVPHTFWLFTKDGRAAQGEGLSDAAALRQVRAAIAASARATATSSAERSLRDALEGVESDKNYGCLKERTRGAVSSALAKR